VLHPLVDSKMGVESVARALHVNTMVVDLDPFPQNSESPFSKATENGCAATAAVLGTTRKVLPDETKPPPGGETQTWLSKH